MDDLAARILNDSHARAVARVCEERRKHDMRDMQALGRMAASIPEDVYRLICARDPALAAGDQKAWVNWLNSEEGRPFRNVNKI